MQRRKCAVIMLLMAAIVTAGLSGCSPEDTQLVSKTPFPEFSEVDIQGNAVTNEIFSQHDATIVNFWNNGCGTCIAEMPELEEMYQNLKERNVNLIGVGADSGEGDEQLETAKKILEEKGVTYLNIVPSPENALYKEFIAQIAGYPTTYIVDSQGNIVGAPIIGNIKNQMETLNKRLDLISQGK